MTCIGIDMETATFFIVGHHNEISRGALLLVSDVPITPDGVKTQASDKSVSDVWVDMHLEVGIEAMTEMVVRARRLIPLLPAGWPYSYDSVMACDVKMLSCSRNGQGERIKLNHADHNHVLHGIYPENSAGRAAP